MSNYNTQGGVNPLKGRIQGVLDKIDGLERKLRSLDEEINALSNQRLQYQLLGTICNSLDRLEEMGASALFWGDERLSDKQLQGVRESVAEFEKKVGVLDDARKVLQDEISQEELLLEQLNGELAYQEREAERKAQEFIVEREGVVLPYRSFLMPWSQEQEDRKRYRKMLVAVVVFLFTFSGLFMLLRKPPEQKQEVVLDEKIAELVVKKKPPPPKPKPTETPSEVPAGAQNQAAPTTKEAAAASVKNTGLLADSGGFNDILGGADSANLGGGAKVSNAGKTGGASTQSRSVIGSTATGGSGGINTTGISGQGVGGGATGAGITGGGVNIASVESGTAKGVAKDKPLGAGGKGAGPSRTDEEVQVVFDRFKSKLYRIYNRELRNDPTLRGKVVLVVTIQPDGTVSDCVVKSSDLASPALMKDIVAMVKTFNFGAKAGVSALKITYPIDFLPAS